MAKTISYEKRHVFLRMKQARQRDQEWDGDESAVMLVDGETAISVKNSLGL